MTDPSIPAPASIFLSMKRWFPQVLTCLILISLSVPLIGPAFSWLYGNSAIKIVSYEVLPLGGSDFPLVPEKGKALIVNLGPLHLDNISDSNFEFSYGSQIRVIEDGRPLAAHVEHGILRENYRGGFSHWGNTLLISPSEDPSIASKHYTLLYPVLHPQQLAIPHEIKSTLWPIVFVIALLSAFIGIVRRHQASMTERNIFLVALAVFCGYQVFFGSVMTNWGPLNWNTFVFTADSQLWLEPYSASSSRPFGYPSFANLILHFFGTSYSQIDFSKVPLATRLELLDHPLLAVVRGQKVAHYIASLICAWSLMRFLPPALVAVTFAYFFNMLYIPHEFDNLMAETLAHACMFLVVACFAQTIFRASPRWLVALGLACALLINVRSSGIFSIAIFATACAWLLMLGFRRYAFQVLVASTLTFLAFAAPSLYRYFATDFLSPAPMYADAQISFALQVAYKRDVKLIRDSKAQAFFLEAMKWKKEHDADIRSKTEITSELQLLGSNLYQVAHYIADKQGLDQTERRRIYLEVARPILWKHRWAYFALFAEAFDSTITKITRLNKPPFPGFWTLSLIMLAMATFAWSRHSIVAIGLYAAHFAHLVIICLFDVPQQRYVFATEFMVIIGLIFLFIGCLVRARELADRYQRRKQEKIVDPSLQTPSLVR